MIDRDRAPHPLVELTLMRLREFIREPDALLWAFLFPLLLAGGLGVAFRNRPPEPIKVAAATPGLAESLRREPLLDVQILGTLAAREALRTGKIVLDAEPAEGAAMTFRYDPANPEARMAALLAERSLQHGAHTTSIPITEAGSRYIDYLLPGILGMTLLAGALWGITYPIVDARQRKLMRRFRTTPMRRHHYLLSFVIFGFLRQSVEIVFIIGFGIIVFGTPVRGSMAGLAVICAMSALAFGAIGLLIAARIRSAEAANGLMNAVIVPMWMLCGVFFSVRRFPDALQPIIKCLPLTASIEALRANMLQGESLGQLRPELLVLAVWFAVCFPFALKMFRWR